MRGPSTTCDGVCGAICNPTIPCATMHDMRVVFTGFGPVPYCWVFLAVTVCLLRCSAAWGQYVLEDVHDPHRYEPGYVAVPIGYRSGALSAAIGAAGSTTGLLQPQLDSFVYLIGSTNGSYGGVAGMSDLQIRPIDRLFLDWQLSYFRTEHDENNISGNPRFRFETAGANDSAEKDFIPKASNDFIGNFTFKYLFPIGTGRQTIIDHYRLENGLLVGGAGGGDAFWNPAQSGRTYLEAGPTFEYMDIRSPHALRHQWDTNALQVSAVYDNRDYLLTPERGNVTTVSLIRDFGTFGSSNPWTNVSAEFSQYISLGRSNLFRQQVLALDGWTSYTPSWSQQGSGANLKVSGGPPFYAGAELGGLNRMRGFPEDRFHDRAGVYGCAELRLIPVWNPFADVAFLKSADITWLQFVAFVEVGRVADEYTFDKLFSHMKGDGGLGIRVLTQDTVLRIDFAGSNEGIQIWANLDQAF